VTDNKRCTLTLASVFGLPGFRPSAYVDGMAEEGSVVFTGHRPLGYGSNHVPLITRYITRMEMVSSLVF
jgi:hypothetical protein